jgi:hypothetical protein
VTDLPIDEPVEVPPDPVTVDRNDPPSIMAGLGFSPDDVQAVVITRTGLLGIAATYPPTEHDPVPEPPVGGVTDPQEA